MLHSRDEEPTLAGLMDNAERFTSAYILPRDDERLYLELFAKGGYRPELLFGECDIARAAAESRAPKSAWIVSALLPSCNGAEPLEMLTLSRCAPAASRPCSRTGA